MNIWKNGKNRGLSTKNIEKICRILWIIWWKEKYRLFFHKRVTTTSCGVSSCQEKNSKFFGLSFNSAVYIMAKSGSGKAYDAIVSMVDNPSPEVQTANVNAYANMGENLGVTRGAYDVANMAERISIKLICLIKRYAEGRD